MGSVPYFEGETDCEKWGLSPKKGKNCHGANAYPMHEKLVASITSAS